MPKDSITKLNVFLCHASEDKLKVRELYHRLNVDGYNIWFDEKKLVPGQDWKLEIRKGIRSADVIVFCLSTISVAKEGYVQVEIKEALEFAMEKPEGTIFIIPLRLDNCSVPLSIQKWQWVDFLDERGYRELRKSLNFRKKELDTKSNVRENTKKQPKDESNFPKRIMPERIKRVHQTTHAKIKSKRLDPDQTVISLKNADKISCLQHLDIWAQPRTIAFNPSGNFLAVSSNSLTSSTISLYVIQNKSAILERKWNESYLDNYKEALSSSWSIGNQLKNFGLGYTLGGTGITRSLSFSPDGASLASSVSANDNIRIWRVSDGKLLQTLSGHRAGVNTVVYSPNGKIIATGSDDQTIRLWQAENKTLIAVLPTSEYVYSLAFSSDSKFLISGGTRRGVSIWKLSDKGADLLRNVPKSISDDTHFISLISGIAISPDDQFIAFSYNSTAPQGTSSIRLWRVKDGVFANKLGKGDSFNCIVFSPDGQIIVSGTYDGKIQLYKREDGRLINTLHSHRASINNICFHPSGKMLASAAEDGTVRLWGIQS